MHAVSVSGLTKTFYGKKRVQALKQVSLEIEEGEIFGLLGPNGAGKTTLLSILTGLTTPDSGTCRVLGFDIKTELYSILEQTNLIRGFSGVLDKMTAFELLTYYALLYEVKNIKPKVTEVLKKTQLWEHKDSIVVHFSSGMRQRFFIAKALLNSPKLIFMDEPTVGLDVRMAQEMRKIIIQLNKEGTTIILTTHYMQEAEELCDRIAVINKGSIIAEGTPQTLIKKLKTSSLEQVFLQLTEDEKTDPSATV